MELTSVANELDAMPTVAIPDPTIAKGRRTRADNLHLSLGNR